MSVLIRALEHDLQTWFRDELARVVEMVSLQPQRSYAVPPLERRETLRSAPGPTDPGGLNGVRVGLPDSFVMTRFTSSTP